MNQKIITPENNYKEFDAWVEENGCKKILVVCGRSIHYQKSFYDHIIKLENRGISAIFYHDFQPNPLYKNVVDGVSVFREENCDAIIAVGGGSALDVAKCIKLYSNQPGDGTDGKWLYSQINPNTIPFLAMPTTAGTGSEATRYAVIYHDGKKQSITNEMIIPDTVLVDPDTLISLPLYQKKATMSDALCHAIESYWSINSTEESKNYSREAIKGILENMTSYLNNTESGRKQLLIASNLAGKAINITQTTAGHAMCYKITSLFNIAHGHAAILCDRVLYPFMVKNTERCIDQRGEKYLKKTLDEIGIAMDCVDAEEGAQKLSGIFDYLQLEIPTASMNQYEELKTSVNAVRLKNHPVSLDDETIDKLYHLILR